MIECKTLWVKEKMLDTSIFSFSHSVFQKPSSPGSLKVGILWERVQFISSNSLPNKILDLTRLTTFAD